jgi:DNA-binding GntR family transcriptional regulator
MNKKNNTTKVESISSQLMSMIESGQFPSGKKLPGERQLADQFKASYVTIRNAVQLLVDNNILERIHGSGTYVTQSASIPTSG